MLGECGVIGFVIDVPGVVRHSACLGAGMALLSTRKSTPSSWEKRRGGGSDVVDAVCCFCGSCGCVGRWMVLGGID